MIADNNKIKLLRRLKIFIFFLFFSILSFAQGERIQIEYNSSISMNSLFSSGFTKLSWPAKTYNYSPILLNSFSLNYLRSLKDENLLKVGVGFFSMGWKETYTEEPPIYFSGRTDIFKVNYIQIPIDYIRSIRFINLELGLTGNILINEKRIIGPGDKDYFMYELNFNNFVFGIDGDIYYSFNLNKKVQLDLGFNNHFNITGGFKIFSGLLIGLEYITD